MKISIDTQTDTFEDIKKVMHILSGIIERKEMGIASSNYASENKPTDTTTLMSMFSDAPAAPPVPDTPPDFSSFLNLTKKQEERKTGLPRVEVF